MRSHMWRTTERSWAMKTSVRPKSRCRSRSRLRICAWIETSRAETGSSAMISFGLQRERAGDADALPLAAGELVRVAVVVLRVEPDDVHDLLHGLACARPRPCASRGSTYGSEMIVPIVLRGFSDEYGSWKIICISRRSALSSAPLMLAISRPSNVIEPLVGSIRRISSRAVVDLPQPDSPTMPSVSPSRTSRSMPSTACTAPTCCVKITPLVIGKCLTRSRTSQQVAQASVHRPPPAWAR